MQTKPTNWDVFFNREHTTIPFVTIDGVEYERESIVSVKTSGELYENFGIGNCCARSLEIEYYPTSQPQRQATVKLECALQTAGTKWDKCRVLVDWTSGPITVLLRSSGSPRTCSIVGYTSYKVEYSESDSRYYVVGDGETSRLSWETSNPVSSDELTSFISQYPYWYDEVRTYQTYRIFYHSYQSVRVGSTTSITSNTYNYSTVYKGDRISSVVSIDENEYPNNGIKNGYWYVKIGNQQVESGKLNKGTYFISTRQTDHTKGTLKLTCYDAMLKADRPFTDVFPSDENFPIAPSTAVSSIATALGVTVDARTSLNSSFLVEYPADEDGDMTLREMLGRIAVANAGNWVITDTNKLRLVPLQSSASPILLGAACASLDKGIVSDAIGKVEVLNNSGEILQEWVFGSYSGKVMSVVYPDAVPNGGVQTQAANPVAYAIYTALNGYVQYGFKAEACIIDPCVELGDRITVGTTGNTITSTIANEEINFDALYTSDVSAPDADEIEDEYPYQTYQKSVEKKVASAYSKISKTANDIRLEVADIASGLQSSITQNSNSISAIVQNVGARGTVTAASIVASINNDTSQIKISANKVDITGFVTFSDLSTEGETDINGANITTGTISADRIATDISQVNSSLTLGNGTTNNPIIVFRSSGYGGSYIRYYDNCINFYDTNAMEFSTPGYASFTLGGGFSVDADWYVTITNADGYYTQIFNYLAGGSAFRPNSDDDYNLGASNTRWSNVYARNGTIQTSDRNKKKEINYDANMDGFFDKLKPCSYKFIDGTSDRKHYGLIAQDVEDAMTSEGMTGKDFAGFCKDVKSTLELVAGENGKEHYQDIIHDGEYDYSLRYDEFISLCIDQIQKLKARVNALEGN